MRLRLVPLVLMGFVVGLSGTAFAQAYGPGAYNQPPPPPPPQGIVRSGLILGGAVGLGAIGFANCDQCDGLGGLALQLHIGGMIGPNLALVFDGSTVIHPLEDQNGVVSSDVGLIALRAWLGQFLWLTAGVGFGVVSASDDYGDVVARTDAGLAGMVGGGVELLQTDSFTLDIQARVTAARFDYGGDNIGVMNVSVLVGFNWY